MPIYHVSNRKAVFHSRVRSIHRISSNKKIPSMKNHTKLITVTVTGMLFASMSAQGATFTNGGDGVSWEDPLNWDTGVPPSSAGQNIVILGNSQVVFDSGTWSYLATNSLLTSSTEYRGAARLLMGESTAGAANGTHSLTLDPGTGNLINFTSSSSQAIGARAGKNGTLNVQSGIVNIGGGSMAIGSAGNGVLNVSGGSMIFGRSAPNIGTSTGTGAVNITGGSFTTRAGATVGTNGAFNVFGSAATQIGLGSDGTIDGVWTQADGGILNMSIDAGGVTKIFVDDVDTTSTLPQAASFAAGSILNLGFHGVSPFAGTWTLMELENGDITDSGLALGLGVDSGWSFAIDNTGTNGFLTATYVIPEPSAALLGGLGLLALLRRRRN